MKLIPYGPNQTEVQINYSLTIFFSYKTPVACVLVKEGKIYNYKTSKKWSKTTSRHINRWIGSYPAEEKPQDFFDNLSANAFMTETGGI